MNGAIGPDDAFCVTASDHVALDPIWKGAFDVEPGSGMKSGWLRRGGVTAFLTSCNRLTTYADHSRLHPTVIRVEMTDTLGRSLNLTGRLKAACPWLAWMNVRGVMCLIEWETDDGTTFHGVAIESQWTDFVHLFLES